MTHRREERVHRSAQLAEARALAAHRPPRHTSQEEEQAVVALVVANARDEDDAAMLLSVLGLDE